MLGFFIFHSMSFLIRFNASITECFFLFPSLITFWPVVVNYFFVS